MLVRLVVEEEEVKNAESFYIIIQGSIIEIPSENLFVKSSEENKYLLGIKFFEEHFEDSKVWILGKIYLKNFLTVFDSEKEEVRFYNERILDIQEEWEEWYFSDMYSLLLKRNFYLAIGAGSVIFIFLLFVCFVCCRRSALRRRNEHGPLIENEK